MTEESIDDALTQKRRAGNQLLADYIMLLDTPGLTTVETQTVSAWFLKARQSFDNYAKTSRKRQPAGIGQKSPKVAHKTQKNHAA